MDNVMIAENIVPFNFTIEQCHKNKLVKVAIENNMVVEFLLQLEQEDVKWQVSIAFAQEPGKSALNIINLKRSGYWSEFENDFANSKLCNPIAILLTTNIINAKVCEDRWMGGWMDGCLLPTLSRLNG